MASCPIEGFDQPFQFQPQPYDPFCSTGSGTGCTFDPFAIGTHGCFHTTAVTVDGVVGARTFLRNTDPHNCFAAEPQGSVDVIYLFRTNGVYWVFEYHRSATDADLTSTFDLIVSTVHFHS